LVFFLAFLLVFFEEIGRTGFAFAKMRSKQNIIKAGVVLGLLWGV
jgi:membrane protease YdiL (CAAX protease family)